jgi:hypothetical protein
MHAYGWGVFELVMMLTMGFMILMINTIECSPYMYSSVSDDDQCARMCQLERLGYDSDVKSSARVASDVYSDTVTCLTTQLQPISKQVASRTPALKAAPLSLHALQRSMHASNADATHRITSMVVLGTLVARHLR